MRFSASLQRKADPRASLLRLDTSSLYTSEGQQAFARRAVQCTVPSPPLSGHTQIDPLRPSLTQPDDTHPQASHSHSLADPSDRDAAIFASFTAQHGHGWWNFDPLYHQYCAALPPPPPVSPALDSTTHLALHVSESGHVRLSLGIGEPPPPPPVPYSTLASALRTAATELLPTKAKPQPPWFEARESELRALIAGP